MAEIAVHVTYSTAFEGKHIDIFGSFLEIYWSRSLVTVPSQSGGLVCPKGVVEGCGKETLKIPTSVT